MDTTLIDIAHETVAPGYGLVRYHGFELVIEMASGYINATKMCAQAGKNRQFKNWICQKTAIEIIESVVSSAGIPADDLTHVVHQGAANEIRGTYVHRMLVPAIAMWASPDYLVKVAKIMEHEAWREHRALLKEKDDAIARLEKLMEEAKERDKAAEARDKEQTARIDELLGYAKATKTELTEVNEKLDETNMRLEDMQDANEVLEEKVDKLVDKVCEDGAPPPDDKSKCHMLGVFRVDVGVHYVIRRQAKTYRRAVASLMRSHPDAVKLKEYTPVPNAISTHVRNREQVSDSEKHIRFKYNYVYGASDDAIIAMLDTVYNESRAAADAIARC